MALERSRSASASWNDDRTDVLQDLRGKCRINCVNVDAQIHRSIGADSIPDPLDDALHAASEGIVAGVVNLARLDSGEPTVAVIVIIRKTRKSGADASVYVGVIGQQALF